MSGRAQWQATVKSTPLIKEFDELLDIDIRQIDGQHLAIRTSDPNETI
jgi:hypothetical protein